MGRLQAKMEMEDQKESPPAERVGALYLHVPFCSAKCRYCDFYSVPAEADPCRRYLRALNCEAEQRLGLLDPPADSVFVGGGTPTALETNDLAELLALAGARAGSNTEFSVEANPGTLNTEKIGVLVSAGVNRVNLGVQSFDDAELEALGRIHNAKEAREAFNMLRQAGLQNLGLDLIYGIPGQSPRSWQTSLAEALSLEPEHLSCYALSFEKGTPLWSDLQQGRVGEMDETEQEACWYHAIRSAGAAGLAQYEISNFARPGRQCRHNMTYWRNMPYLGLGPGAASYVRGVRRTNLPNLEAYSDALLAGQDTPCSQEHLTGREAMAETVMLALRMTEGLDLAGFKARYGQDVRNVFRQSLDKHLQTGWLKLAEGRLRIPVPAMFVSNEVLADILAEA